MPFVPDSESGGKTEWILPRIKGGSEQGKMHDSFSVPLQIPLNEHPPISVLDEGEAPGCQPDNRRTRCRRPHCISTTKIAW